MDGSAYTLQWATPSPSKLPLTTGDLNPHLIHSSYGPPKSTTQTASWSVHQFLRGSRLWKTDWQTDRATRSVTVGHICVLSTAVRPKNVVIRSIDRKQNWHEHADTVVKPWLSELLVFCLRYDILLSYRVACCFHVVEAWRHIRNTRSVRRRWTLSTLAWSTECLI